MVAYDEFALFRENADEVGLPWTGPPTVRRVSVDTPNGALSALVWGERSPELVFLHGGAQNAHTWDTVALALDRPLVAIDLPGHGHSAWRDDKDYRPVAIAPDVAHAIGTFAPDAQLLCGMSMGGLTSIALTARFPDLVRRLAIVDVTPGVNRDKAADIAAFVGGPESFPDFDAILKRTIEFNPTRSESSLRRGVLHNAVEQPDGTWRWRYDRPKFDQTTRTNELAQLWDDISGFGCPVLLLRGGRSPVVDDDDVAEFRRRQPEAEVVVIDDAGHSIQGDQPLALAAELDRFLRT